MKNNIILPPLTILLEEGTNPFSKLVEKLTAKKTKVSHTIVVIDGEYAIEALWHVKISPLKKILKTRKIRYSITFNNNKAIDISKAWKTAALLKGAPYDYGVTFTHFLYQKFGIGIKSSKRYNCVEVAKYMIKNCIGSQYSIFNEFATPSDLLTLLDNESWTINSI